jgi:hypothetical protein
MWVPIRELGPLDLLEAKCHGLITRAAGTGAPGNTGDDGPATDAQLNEPVEVAVTTDGAFLITDAADIEVRKVSAGVITRVAGTGTPGNTGDDGPATDAQLNRPFGRRSDPRRRVHDRRRPQQRSAQDLS